jgi:hypothetical protein
LFSKCSICSVKLQQNTNPRVSDLAKSEMEF